MQPTERVEFQLPKDIVKSLNDAVASGIYPTQSEIVREALIQWQRQRNWAIDELRRLWDEGIASGIAPEESIEDIIAEARREFERRNP